MSYGGPATKRDPGLAKIITTAAESIGLLNKGSAEAPAAPDKSDAAEVQPVSSNTLNVTRVGGVITLIGAAGGAALLIFNVDKAKDRAPVVVAAYLSVGAIVVAALFTVAIIIASDIRARADIAAAASPVPPLRAEVKHIVAEASAGPYVVSLDRTYDYVIIDSQAAAITLTLPSADSSKWQQMKISREDNTQRKVTIQAQGQEQIAGNRTRSMKANDHIQIYSNGETWLNVQ